MLDGRGIFPMFQSWRTARSPLATLLAPQELMDSALLPLRLWEPAASALRVMALAGPFCPSADLVMIADPEACTAGGAGGQAVRGDEGYNNEPRTRRLMPLVTITKVFRERVKYRSAVLRVYHVKNNL